MVGVSDDPYLPTPYLRGHPARGVATSATCFRRSTPSGAATLTSCCFRTNPVGHKARSKMAESQARGRMPPNWTSTFPPSALPFQPRPSAGCLSPSEQCLGQQLIVVADQKAATDPARRRPQLTGPTEQQLEQFCVGRAIRAQVEANDLPTLRDPELVDPIEQLERGVSLDRLSVGALEFAILDSMLRKKLLRLFTALSARAVIPPFESIDHVRALPVPPRDAGRIRWGGSRMDDSGVAPGPGPALVSLAGPAPRDQGPRRIRQTRAKRLSDR